MSYQNNFFSIFGQNALYLNSERLQLKFSFMNVNLQLNHKQRAMTKKHVWTQNQVKILLAWLCVLIHLLGKKDQFKTIFFIKCFHSKVARLMFKDRVLRKLPRKHLERYVETNVVKKAKRENQEFLATLKGEKKAKIFKRIIEEKLVDRIQIIKEYIRKKLVNSERARDAINELRKKINDSCDMKEGKKLLETISQQQIQENLGRIWQKGLDKQGAESEWEDDISDGSDHSQESYLMFQQDYPGRLLDIPVQLSSQQNWFRFMFNND